MGDAIKEDARQIHPHRDQNLLITGIVKHGDIDKGFADAQHMAEMSFSTSYVEHAYIEPEAGAAWMDGDTVVIQAYTQAPIMDRDETAKVLGLAEEKVRIIPSATGGGFGSKLICLFSHYLGWLLLKRVSHAAWFIHAMNP